LTPSEEESPVDRLQRVAEPAAYLVEATGGRSFDPPELNPSAARDIIGFLAGEVRTEYIIGFSPEPGSRPSLHKIEIRLLGSNRGAKMIGGSRMAAY